VELVQVFAEPEQGASVQKTIVRRRSLRDNDVRTQKDELLAWIKFLVGPKGAGVISDFKPSVLPVCTHYQGQNEAGWNVE
jgi:hypothetical protein